MKTFETSGSGLIRSGYAMLIDCVKLSADGILHRAMPVTKSKCSFYILFCGIFNI